MIDWTATWGVVGPAVIGLGTWLKMRKPNQARLEAAVAVARAETTATQAGSTVVELLRQEVQRLDARMQALDAVVAAMQKREGRLIRHVYRLEGLMRGANLVPPPFDIDSDEPIKAGGTD